MKTIRNLKLASKRALVRCDFNVPLRPGSGEILDDFRIRETLPTIKYLIKKRAKVILISHLGRPGEVKSFKSKVKGFSLRPVAEALSKLLKQEVRFLDDCVGEKVEKEISKMTEGQIVLLENVRFYKEETENSDEFSRKLARLGNVFVNDAFAVAHREQASVTGLPKYLPSAAGFLMEKEINALDAMKRPKRPLAAIIGGKKVEKEKLELINNFSAKGCVLLGGLVNEAIKKEKIELKHPQRVIWPLEEKAGKDLSPETVEAFKREIKRAKTIFWNGPLGKIEEKKFQRGSREIAEAIAESKAFSVIGGGQIVGFVNKLGLAKKFNHISTGGGAMLAYLGGEKLPGIEALK